MYEQFYGLREKPFALAPDPEFLFLGRHHRRALTLLEYALQQRHGLRAGDRPGGLRQDHGGAQRARARQRRTSRSGSSPIPTAASASLLPWVARAIGMKRIAASESELYETFVDFLDAANTRPAAAWC